MSVTEARRLRISTLCLAIVWVAVAATLARCPEVWLALNVRNIGYPAAICVYTWFWVGLALVVYHPTTTPRRFFGFAGLFLSMLIIPGLLPQTQVAVLPNYHGYFMTAMLLGSLAFIGAGASARLLESVLPRAKQA
jgi:hypothetical protein